jgi:hypothetical protein
MHGDSCTTLASCRSDSTTARPARERHTVDLAALAAKCEHGACAADAAPGGRGEGDSLLLLRACRPQLAPIESTTCMPLSAALPGRPTMWDPAAAAAAAVPHRTYVYAHTYGRDRKNKKKPNQISSIDNHVWI